MGAQQTILLDLEHLGRKQVIGSYLVEYRRCVAAGRPGPGLNACNPKDEII